MQRVKTSVSFGVFLFSIYFQPINHVHETRFSKHNFKQSHVFPKHVKWNMLKLLGQKLWNNFPTTADKNIVTITCFQQRTKESFLSCENGKNYYYILSVLFFKRFYLFQFYFQTNSFGEFYPADTGRKLNVHKTFRRRPGRLLNVLCMFNLRLVSTEYLWWLVTRSAWSYSIFSH